MRDRKRRVEARPEELFPKVEIVLCGHHAWLSADEARELAVELTQAAAEVERRPKRPPRATAGR